MVHMIEIHNHICDRCGTFGCIRDDCALASRIGHGEHHASPLYPSPCCGKPTKWEKTDGTRDYRRCPCGHGGWY